MFDGLSRNQLDERLGYERFVLDACETMVRKAKGISSAGEVVISDNHSLKATMHVADYFGSDHGAKMVAEMSALLFVAAYKTLDMIIEWVIVENEGSCPWRFSEKLQIVNSTAKTLKYPDFLDTDIQLQMVLRGFYNLLQNYRNAITHGRWGEVQEGALIFDFDKDGILYRMTIPFQSLLDFIALVSLLAHLLVRPTQQTSYRIATLRWLCDRTATLHGEAVLNISQPSFYEVIRETAAPSLPVSISLADIRHKLTQLGGDPNPIFDLRVEGVYGGRTFNWTIPADSVPTTDELVLDPAWDSFRTN
jgi:hypothetical protein